jgi:ceramide glucosyltransferase
MHLQFLTPFLLAFLAIPFIYYSLVLFSSWRFFNQKRSHPVQPFTPPVSNLKPVRGLDPDAYENFASFCQQDYPEYEVIFCLGDADDPALPVIEQVKKDFPQTKIRVFFGSGRVAVNDKVAKLVRMSNEAAYEHLVISDSDVRVRPDYLRQVIAPMADLTIGAVTCLYVSLGDTSFIEDLQTVGMISDFYAGLMVARQLDGVKFALGPTIATTRTRLAAFGGYEAIENRPGDDLLVGRLIAEQGYRIELPSYVVETVSDYQSMQDLLQKRMRWLVVMRHMRPAGHFGLLFTQGLPFSLLAVAIHPTLATAIAFLGLYFLFRFAIFWKIGISGLKQTSLWSKFHLVVAWDAFAFGLWSASFLRNTIRWRGGHYYIRNGELVPAIQPTTN